MATEKDFGTFEQKYSERSERQRLKGLWWAVVLIWTGLVFAVESLGLVPRIGNATAWSWIFLGAGIIGILGCFFRLALSGVPKPTAWDWVWAAVCVIIGLDGFVTLNIFWPLLLISVGGLFLISGFWSSN